MIDYNRFKTLNLDADSPVGQGLSLSGYARKHYRVFQQPDLLCLRQASYERSEHP